MKELDLSAVSEKVAELAWRANTKLRPDVMEALEAALAKERSPLGKRIIGQLIENAKIAEDRDVPICQDTGIASVFVELGRDVKVGGDLNEAIQNGVRKAYRERYFRKSINAHPALGMENTGDNAPATVEIELVPGERLQLTVMPKGGGSENASALAMLPVSGGLRAVEDFVLEVASRSVSACPPIILGVAIGGDFASAGSIAKRALLRRVDDENGTPKLAALERSLLEKINDLGIGPAGLGGTVTALAVKVEERPCHIACLPVAVCVSCHALRSATGAVS